MNQPMTREAPLVWPPPLGYTMRGGCRPDKNRPIWLPLKGHMIPPSILRELAEPYLLSEDQVAFYQKNRFIKLKNVFGAGLLEFFSHQISQAVAQKSAQASPEPSGHVWQGVPPDHEPLARGRGYPCPRNEQATGRYRQRAYPEVISMLHLAWSEHGKLPWKEGFNPAIKHAENGYALTKRTAELAALLPKLTEPGEGVKAHFLDKDGKPLGGNINEKPCLWPNFA